MGGGPVPNPPNGINSSNGDMSQREYERILKLREDVFAGTHPRLKVPTSFSADPSKPSNNSSSETPASRLQNGVHEHERTQTSHLQVPQINPMESQNSPSPLSTSTPPTYRPPNIVSTPMSGSKPAAINPIFLTKSEVLVKAELQQKRQRIERALEEQVKQAKLASRLKSFDQEAVPDFDVVEVLRKAQDIVKPFKPVESNAANRTASSSDSFDENTFYSSQMNESTTEEADESKKLRSDKVCSFPIDGHCRLGRDCTFSHDAEVKRAVADDASRAINVDGVNADEQVNPKQPGASLQPPANGSGDTTSQSHLSRIAELEEQIRILKSQPQKGPQEVTSDKPVTHRKVSEEQPYSPPGTGEIAVNQHAGREEIPPRERGQRIESGERRDAGNIQQPSREYARHNHKSHSPSNEVRVVRNHITSPIAPQPARVSPLAVARVPQISQGMGLLTENDGLSRGSGGEVSGVRQSPYGYVQPVNPRKRRREIDSDDRARHVLPRREILSPEIRVKAEPVSPPLYSAPAEILQPRRRQEVSRPIYIDTDSPRQGDRQPVVYQQATAIDRFPEAYASDERRPPTPVARRILSRNTHQFDPHEEQDLRRVVSARHLRAPRSPERFAVPQPSSARAASHVYVPQPVQYISRPPRTSVQPLSIPHTDHDRAFSPVPQANMSPDLRPISMAPPRRIVIDQYGQKYFEAPSASDRQASVIPLVRAGEYVSRYEPHLARSTSIRDHPAMEVYDERQYRRRAPSPLSPRYVQYHPDPKPRQIFEGEGGQLYGEEAYVPRPNEIRMVNQAELRSSDQFDDGRPREMFGRTQSVRPVSGQFEEPRGQISRVQSVRPGQDRIVSLERRAEIAPYRSRQVSVRDDDSFSRASRGGVERPKYQYAPEVSERRYVEEFRNDDVVFEAGSGSARRPIERL